MLISDVYDLYLKAGGKIYTDTRKIKNPGGLFFSLSGQNFNGNKFAATALELGCIAAVIDDAAYFNGEQYKLCPNSLTCLQDLARHHRSQLDIPIVAITGSNGKTTTKELTHAILSSQYNVSSTIGNLNNYIGVPLTLLGISPLHQLAVIELGTNHPGEIKFLSEMVMPTSGLISSIGKAHLEGLGNIEGVAKEKLSLFTYLKNNGGTIFLNTESPYLTKEGILNYEHVIKYSSSSFQNSKLNITRLFPNIHASCEFERSTLTIRSKLYGEHNLLNIIAAMTIGRHYGITNEDMTDAVAMLNLQNNRTETINLQNAIIYLDAYNANPTSMSHTIKSFALSQSIDKWLILGDMYELGENEINEHQSIVELILGYQWQKIILVGEIFYQTQHSEHINYFKTFEECKSWFDKQQLTGQEILIKASRGMGLERLVKKV